MEFSSNAAYAVPDGEMPVEVELRVADGELLRVSGSVLETNLPFHVHCRVLVAVHPSDSASEVRP